MPDIIPGFNLNFDILGIFAGATQVMNMIIIIAVIGIATFFLMRFTVKFPTDFDIFQIKNGSLQQVDTDKGRRVKKKDGEEYYQIKKRKFKWYPPTFEGQLGVSGGKRAKIYVQELSHNVWQVIDPKVFVTGKPEDYKILENEGTIRFWKNLEENKAKFKWNKDDKWKKIMDVLPLAIICVGVGLVFYFLGNYIIIPIMDRSAGIQGQTVEVLNYSAQLMNKSVQYIDMLTQMLIANGIKVPTTVNGTVIR